MKIYESALDPSLKPLAVLLALFGTEDGERIFPSIARMAYLIGSSPRTVDRHLARLRALGVLSALGRGRSVMYRLRPEALPARDPFTPAHWDLFTARARVTTPSETEITPSETEITSPVTCTSRHSYGVRSSIDLPIEQREERSRARDVADLEYRKACLERVKAHLRKAR